MGGRKLATYVHVDGQVFGPDDNVPADVAEKITNPKAWAEAPADAPADDGGTATTVSVPPRSGKGSGVDAWTAYAATLDPPVDVAEGTSRDDVIAAIEAAGHPVE